MSKKVQTNWIGLPDGFSPVGYEGFVYLIVCTLTDVKYIGRKYFWSKTRKRIKGKKRRTKVVKESDWQFYKSSCDELKKDISKYGVEAFEFHILSLHKTRSETNYTEVKEQFSRDVLHAKLGGEYEYYNTNILARYYRKRSC